MIHVPIARVFVRTIVIKQFAYLMNEICFAN